MNKGTGEELIKKAYADSEESGREYERVVKYVDSIFEDEANRMFGISEEEKNG